MSYVAREDDVVSGEYVERLLISSYDKNKEKGSSYLRRFLEKLVFIYAGCKSVSLGEKHDDLLLFLRILLQKERPEEEIESPEEEIESPEEEIESPEDKLELVAEHTMRLKEEKYKEITEKLVRSYIKNQENGEVYLQAFLKNFLDNVVLCGVGCQTMPTEHFHEYDVLFHVSARAFMEGKCDEKAKSVVREILEFEKEKYSKISRGVRPCCISECNMRSHRRYRDESVYDVFSPY